MESVEHLTVIEIWGLIEQRLHEKRESYQGVYATYEFRLKDEADGTYQLVFEGDKATVYRFQEQAADSVLQMKTKHFKKFLEGKLNSTAAFMTGKIKIDGDISLALRLEKMLKQYQISER